LTTISAPLLPEPLENAEISMLGLHLLQSGVVHLNTLLLQQVLTEPAWAARMTDDDRRGLTPLFWSHINPYGTFRLDMDTRLELAAAPSEEEPSAVVARLR
jgi:hypothetical protein